MSNGNETAIVPASRETGLAFPPDKVELLKRTICKGASDDELELFLHVSKRTGLDPFARQIHAVKRWQDGREVMTVQTGIDGYRLIAERSDRYMPGREATFEYDEDGQVVCATAYIKKLDKLGQWHEVSASARFEEYCGRKKDGSPTSMWANKPHIMLAKCAEALVLRKAFPAELSGIYTREEMEQAENDAPPIVRGAPTAHANGGGPAAANGAREVVEGEEEPDLSNDVVFMGAWHDTLRGREWKPTEAETVLKGLLEKNNKTLQQTNVKGRRELLVKADEGKYDAWRDGLRAKARQQQQGGGEGANVTAPAATTTAETGKGGDGGGDDTAAPTEDEVSTWDKFLALAREAAGDNLDDETFLGGIQRHLVVLGKKGKEKDTSKPLRVKLLTAIRAGAFDFGTGKINQVTHALA